MINSQVLSFINKKLKDLEISRYEGDALWFSDSVIGPSCMHFHQKSFLVITKDRTSYWWVNDIDDVMSCGRESYRRYHKNPSVLRREFEQSARAYREGLRRVLVTNSLGTKAYQDFKRICAQFGVCSIAPLDGLDRYLSHKIAEIIPEAVKRAELTFPLHSSFIQQFQDRLRAIVGGLSVPERKSLERGIVSHTLQQKLSVLREEWGWVFNNLGSWELPSDAYIFERAKECSMQFDHESNELKHMRARRMQKKRALQKCPAELRACIELLDMVIELRDRRKEAFMRTVIPYKQWFRRASESSGFRYEEMRLLRMEEQLKLDANTAKQFRAAAKERAKGSLYCYGFTKNRTEIISGAEAAACIKALFRKKKQNVLNGTPASSGSVRGTVRLIATSHEFTDFKKGEILVASHTTPDFVPLMKKAKAILTERGGITSHAALISRELGTPCIVGISGLIASLKTGDRVEVDVEKGIVTRL